MNADTWPESCEVCGIYKAGFRCPQDCKNYSTMNTNPAPTPRTIQQRFKMKDVKMQPKLIRLFRCTKFSDGSLYGYRCTCGGYWKVYQNQHHAPDCVRVDAARGAKP